MQIPGRNWRATSWLFQYLAVHCIIHFACYTASPFGGIASSLMYCLGADCVIHCRLQVARSLLKASKSQKQWKVHKLGPTPVLYPAWSCWGMYHVLFQEGESSNFRLRRGVGQTAHTHNNPRIKCTGVYCTWTVNNADTNELYWVQFSGSRVPSVTLTLIVQLHSKLPVTILDTSADCPGSQGSYCYICQPTHCSRTKHLAWQLVNKKK